MDEMDKKTTVYIVGTGTGNQLVGKFIMTAGSLSKNKSIAGSGGGVYINGGALDMKKSNEAGVGTISGNTAKKNGGGICMMNGEVKIEEGNISGNTAEEYGGGLYVYNENEINIPFTGGFFSGNKAFAGGGVCVNGPINLNINNTQIVNNTANNGGGICLLDAAQMTFGIGAITANHAVSKLNGSTFNTAYQVNVNDVHGIGGGVYLGSGRDKRHTKLIFSVLDNLGIYGNDATIGADDIFANGKYTTVLLPPDEKMVITNFSAAGQFSWVKDYMTNDPKYDQGFTPLADGEWASGKNLRYRVALQDPDTKRYSVKPEENGTEYNCYVSLTLGYEIVYIIIRKKGLGVGESAIFQLMQQHNSAAIVENAKSQSIIRIVLTGDGNEWVEKKVALVSDVWKVREEMTWSWTYNNETSEKTQNIENEKVFEFENINKGNLPDHHETIKINGMGTIINTN